MLAIKQVESLKAELAEERKAFAKIQEEAKVLKQTKEELEDLLNEIRQTHKKDMSKMQERL